MPAHRGILTDPVSWALGGLGAVASVAGAIALDPTGAVAAVVLTIIQQSGTIFTVSSIFGFTVAPEIPSLEPWVPVFKGVAIGTGLIFAMTLIDNVWDNFKERVL